jgi:hypothetical protein
MQIKHRALAPEGGSTDMLVHESVPSTVKTLPINKREYEEFLLLQRRDRFDWWAVFSVDRDERVWPYVCRKLTPLDDRHYVETRERPLLAQVAGNLVSRVKEIGGRFFINQDGAYYLEGDCEPRGATPVQFIEWRADEPLMNNCMKRDFLNSLRGSETPQSHSLRLTLADLRAKQRGH